MCGLWTSALTSRTLKTIYTLSTVRSIRTSNRLQLVPIRKWKKKRVKKARRTVNGKWIFKGFHFTVPLTWAGRSLIGISIEIINLQSLRMECKHINRTQSMYFVYFIIIIIILIEANALGKFLTISSVLYILPCGSDNWQWEWVNI